MVGCPPRTSTSRATTRTTTQSTVAHNLSFSFQVQDWNVFFSHPFLTINPLSFFSFLWIPLPFHFSSSLHSRRKQHISSSRPLFSLVCPRGWAHEDIFSTHVYWMKNVVHESGRRASGTPQISFSLALFKRIHSCSVSTGVHPRGLVCFCWMDLSTRIPLLLLWMGVMRQGFRTACYGSQ
jgi:hypothetical protein